MSRTPGTWRVVEEGDRHQSHRIVNEREDWVCHNTPYEESAPHPDDMKYIVALQRFFEAWKAMVGAPYSEKLVHANLALKTASEIEQLER